MLGRNDNKNGVLGRNEVSKQRSCRTPMTVIEDTLSQHDGKSVILRRSRKIHVERGRGVMVGAERVNSPPVLIWMLRHHVPQHDGEERKDGDERGRRCAKWI